jgi:hypothetical protein
VWIEKGGMQSEGRVLMMMIRIFCLCVNALLSIDSKLLIDPMEQQKANE